MMLCRFWERTQRPDICQPMVNCLVFFVVVGPILETFPSSYLFLRRDSYDRIKLAFGTEWFRVPELLQAFWDAMSYPFRSHECILYILYLFIYIYIRIYTHVFFLYIYILCPLTLYGSLCFSMQFRKLAMVFVETCCRWICLKFLQGLAEGLILVFAQCRKFWRNCHYRFSIFVLGICKHWSIVLQNICRS